MTRIVAGRAGGRRLAVPTSGTRPTSDRTREALFSALNASLGGFDGLRVLDLYAGSGAVGLEAWSRGAATVVLVESAPVAITALRSNVATLTQGIDAPTIGADHEVSVIAGKAETVLRGLTGQLFDLVFADPPYAMDSSEVAATLSLLVERSLLAEDAMLVVERAARAPWSWPDGVQALRDRRYGDSVLWYGRAGRSDTRPSTDDSQSDTDSRTEVS